VQLPCTAFHLHGAQHTWAPYSRSLGFPPPACLLCCRYLHASKAVCVQLDCHSCCHTRRDSLHQLKGSCTRQASADRQQQSQRRRQPNAQTGFQVMPMHWPAMRDPAGYIVNLSVSPGSWHLGRAEADTSGQVCPHIGDPSLTGAGVCRLCYLQGCRTAALLLCHGPCPAR
jgi:hypothetical protein